tara:strand:+ start:153 stop:305 length:153 start_codon:yes stop_codon:yes gene_type:complete
MPKQEAKNKKDLAKEMKDTLERLEKQREQAKATWERCTGAIEVLSNLLEE